MIGIILLWLFVAVNIALLLWVILQAFRDTRSILNHPLGWPHSWAVTNFIEAWNVAGFGRAAINSIGVTAVASVLTVALAAPAAYHLSRHESRLTGGITMYFILGLGIPAQIIIIPLFVMLAKVGLTNSLIGLVIVYIGVGMPFTVFLLTAFFRSLPSELEEAAALDGASPVSTFIRVMLPVARGGLVTALVLQIIAN
ncbi:carbohydrate ABC transporter permease [Leekyejoonella antrihumi]|uniref:carbohydrate ABC transporter permease n=1 Tax=Leekyejoonella antrihumi TaxID=1660198 RepID=UPI001FE25AF9|nr:carbohydrate ABC transporter permease [Leekyejoonella antrihumi]